MRKIGFNLTVDNMFDFCELIETIGIESVTKEFSKEELETLKTEDAGTVGMTVITKLSGLIIRTLPRVRNEVCKFLAGCAEYEDGIPLVAEDIRRMKISQLVKMIRDFLKEDGIVDFFGGAAGLLDTAQPDLKNSVTDDTAMPTDI